MAQYEDKDMDKIIEDVPVVPAVQMYPGHTAGLKTQDVYNVRPPMISSI